MSFSGIIRVSDEEEEVEVEVEEPSLPSAQMWALLQDSVRAFNLYFGRGRWVEVQRIAKPRATDSVILIRDFHQVLNRLARVPPPHAARIPQPNVEVLQRIGAQVAQITIYCGPNSCERTPLIEGLVDGLLICRDKTGRSGKASIAYALCKYVQGLVEAEERIIQQKRVRPRLRVADR